MGVLLGKETAQWVVEQKNKSDSGGSGGQRRFTPDQPAKPFTQTFRNDSGETCPAFGCLKVTDAEEDSTTGRYVLVIDKPDGTGGPFFFNGPREVLDGEYGQAHTGLVKADTRQARRGLVKYGGLNLIGPLSQLAIQRLPSWVTLIQTSF
jgi:hypothetical protein